MFCRTAKLSSFMALSSAVQALKPLCPSINSGIHRQNTCSLAQGMSDTNAAEARLKLLSSLPDSSDIAVSGEACTNRIVLSGTVSEVTTGFSKSARVMQFVLDGEFAVRSPFVDDARLEWLRAFEGKEVIVSGQLRHELHLHAGKIFQFPHVWICPDVFQVSSIYVLPASPSA